MCVCVCVYVCMCVYSCVCVYVCMHVCVHGKERGVVTAQSNSISIGAFMHLILNDL